MVMACQKVVSWFRADFFACRNWNVFAYSDRTRMHRITRMTQLDSAHEIGLHIVLKRLQLWVEEVLQTKEKTTKQL